jgi:hypothetical protein
VSAYGTEIKAVVIVGLLRQLGLYFIVSGIYCCIAKNIVSRIV